MALNTKSELSSKHMKKDFQKWIKVALVMQGLFICNLTYLFKAVRYNTLSTERFSTLDKLT